MAKKLNSMPDYTAHLPKHPHDVSQSFAFTACPGMILPVYYDMLHTGDELHFSASEFVRLNPLQGQPLGEIDIHLDYFFVPLPVMYLPSSSMFYQTDDLVSSYFSSPNFRSSNFPVFNFKSWLKENWTTNYEGQTDQIDSDDCVLFDTDRLGNCYLDASRFECLGNSVLRMWDMLDMAPEFIVYGLEGIQTSSGAWPADSYPNFTPWFSLAYQAIYQDYFRNDDREPRNYHYNIDKYSDTSSWTENLREGDKKSIFALNYVSRSKDYFNSVKVSPIASSVSLLSSASISQMYSSVNQWLTDSVNYPVDVTGMSDIDIDSSQSVAFDPGDTSATISADSIRQLFMVDKLLRVVGRSEKNYESQFLAHFGIKIPHDVIHSISHLGHDMVTLTPEGIISQADTFNASSNTGSALGEIGGKGSAMLSGKKRHFNAPFHGVFMVTTHIIPRRRYVLGLNKLHMLNSPVDFYQPEFDRKGMQPLFAYEGFFGMKGPYVTSINDRRGWQFAYEQFKRKCDKVSRAFAPSRDARYLVNSYSPWVISAFPFTSNKTNQSIDIPESINASDLLVSPNDLNVNMVVPHSTWFNEGLIQSEDIVPMWLLYQTDPFICDFNLYIKKVNCMSEYGEPEL